MSVVSSTGTVTTTTSLQTIVAPASAGTFKLFIDLNQLTAPDRYTLQVRRKIRAADSAVSVLQEIPLTFSSDKIAETRWFDNATNLLLDFRIRRDNGSDYTLGWSLETPV